ncbi:biotinidase-like isoform X2 [Rhincodon typus]|uniref:biotinidase-like isoform X2 n=1 Tax=Rhincodon typus TaxID=259920 RepID=UPI00202E652A|nr:biotinidase-like isoform X2 [Rhincodon typus]
METFGLRWLLLGWQCLVIPAWGQEFYTAAVYEHAAVLNPSGKIPSTRQGALRHMKKNLDIYQEQVFAASKQVLHQLSCMARNGSMYLIANMGERQTCEQSDPKCPPDGRYQFNTNVVFDSEGTLTAKYQKWNLYFEVAYDTPKTMQHIIFNTPFAGRFGVFTCFDILFYEPAVSLIENYGVKQIIFPTAWMNQLPLLSAIEFHQAFAAAFGINLFAANQHHPEYNMTGSGIYIPLDFPYYYNSESSEGKLLVAKVPIITSTQNYSLQQSKSQMTSAFLEETNYLEASLLQKEGGKQEQTGPLESSDPGYVFHNVMMFDNYTFISLTGLKGNLQVCSNTLCCHVAYERSNYTPSNLYALGAYDGLHTVDGTYYTQVCALVKCAGSSYDTCGQSVTTASDIIDFRLWGNFSTTHIYPAILADGMKIYRADTRGWTNNNYYMTKKGMSAGLVTAVLYGRWYEKDYCC